MAGRRACSVLGLVLLLLAVMSASASTAPGSGKLLRPPTGAGHLHKKKDAQQGARARGSHGMLRFVCAMSECWGLIQSLGFVRMYKADGRAREPAQAKPLGHLFIYSSAPTYTEKHHQKTALDRLARARGGAKAAAAGIAPPPGTSSLTASIVNLAKNIIGVRILRYMYNLIVGGPFACVD